MADEEDQSQNFYERNKQYVRPGIDNFTTKLAPADEIAFKKWVKDNKVPFELDDKNPDYDMRGFWRGLMTGDPHAHTGIDPNDKKLHFSDYWKTPYHETFSNESMYAKPDAPGWKGDQLVDSKGNVIFDDAAPRNSAPAQPQKQPQQMMGNTNVFSMPGSKTSYFGNSLAQLPPAPSPFGNMLAGLYGNVLKGQ